MNGIPTHRKVVLNLKWTLFYAVFGFILIAGELRGVWDPKKGDTISENVWVLERFWPFRLLIPTATLIGGIVLAKHFYYG